MNAIIEKLEEFLEWGGIKKEIFLLVISGIALLASLLEFSPEQINLAWIAIILCGAPIILEAIIGLITEFDIKADVLVAMALIASVVIGETFAAGEVAFIMQLGALLEDITVSKARTGIEKLVKLTPTTARVIKDGIETIISATEVEKGDILRVLAGETIAVDGEIISGETSIDQTVMTGESMPVDKSCGDEVFSGTVNQYGIFEMKATKVGEDSSVQRMIKLVKSADASKAKIVSLADRWATWIVVLAVTFAILSYIFTGEIIRSVTVLVVFCPCALVLATPTAIMAAIGNVTKYGFLVREGDALEKLSKVKCITFDKTGTLTLGKPQVSNITTFSKWTEEELFKMAASAELRSEHPLGKALVDSYKKNNTHIIEPKFFTLAIGKGVIANVDNHHVFAGNMDFMEEKEIVVSDNQILAANQYSENGSTIIWVAIDNELCGFVAMSDAIKDGVGNIIEKTKTLGLEPILLTGDNEASANSIAKHANISRVVASCLPEMKLQEIQNCQNNGSRVCMVGDGINDAPALKVADVGIAMGGIGSDIAVEAADIVLINDDISQLPHLISISKRMMTIIKLNMIFSMSLNFIAIILAMTGILTPIVGALVHNAGSILVILCSATLLKWHE